MKYILTCVALMLATPAYAQINNPSVTNGEVRMVAAELTNAVQYSVPTTGQTVVSNGSGVLFLNPAGLLVSLTVTVPSAPVDGQSFEVASSQAITTLTMNGGTIKGALTTFVLNGWARWRYSSSAAAWFRAS